MIANHVDHQSGSRDDRDSIQCLAPLDQKRSIPVLCPGWDEVFDQSGAAGGISEHPGRQCHPATGGGLMGCGEKTPARLLQQSDRRKVETCGTASTMIVPEIFLPVNANVCFFAYLRGKWGE